MPAQNQTGRAIERGTADLPLATLLSQTLVAFTIELDNEFEHRMPHRTTNHGSSFGPWLASMAMYLNCMKFTGDEGVTVSELERLARTTTNLHGMQRWGYVVVEGGPDSKRSQSPNRRPVARPGRDWIVRPTLRGKMAREVWGPLFGVIEERWQARFGRDEIQRLREALSALLSQMDVELPECLPILGYGLFSRGPGRDRGGRVESDPALPTALPVLLAKVLLVFAIEFEGESEISLAIGANVLRVLDEEGVRVRDLPQLSGVSKEAISMAMGILGKKDWRSLRRRPGAGQRSRALRPGESRLRMRMADCSPRSRSAGGSGSARTRYVIYTSRLRG